MSSALADDGVVHGAVYEEVNGLRLNVTGEVETVWGINKDTKQKEPRKHTLVIRSAVTNTGKKPVIVPSNSYDGGPSCWITGGDSYGICFTIGNRVMGDRRLSPSPLRFFPVVLQPGEATELPIYETALGDPSLVKKVVVEFVVDETYARRQKWWFGELRKEVKVEPPYPTGG